jgi:hypothetical protein
MENKKLVAVTVSVDESHKNKLAAVISDLKGKGFVLKESLGAIGVLTGSVPASSLADLSKVSGVSGVEEDRTDYRPQS